MHPHHVRDHVFYIASIPYGKQLHALLSVSLRIQEGEGGEQTTLLTSEEMSTTRMGDKVDEWIKWVWEHGEWKHAHEASVLISGWHFEEPGEKSRSWLHSILRAPTENHYGVTYKPSKLTYVVVDLLGMPGKEYHEAQWGMQQILMNARILAHEIGRAVIKLDHPFDYEYVRCLCDEKRKASEQAGEGVIIGHDHNTTPTATHARTHNCPYAADLVSYWDGTKCAAPSTFDKTTKNLGIMGYGGHEAVFRYGLFQFAVGSKEVRTEEEQREIQAAVQRRGETAANFHFRDFDYEVTRAVEKELGKTSTARSMLVKEELDQRVSPHHS